MDLVVVTWLDAHAETDFCDPEKLDRLHEPKTVQSVGWVYQQDDTGVTLVGCQDDDGDFDRHLFVPASMIRDVKKLSARRSRAQ